MVSHGYWSRRLGEDPLVVGRTLRFDGVPLTVVGVAMRGFSGAADSPPAFWMPIGSYHQLVGGSPIDEHATALVAVIGRIKPGVTVHLAESRLGILAVGMPPSPTDRGRQPLNGVRLVPAYGATTAADTWRVALIVAVIGTVLGLILLLACVNVANLLLASGISRQREIAVRLALGASRGRLMRQLLTESFSLGLAGGVLGLLLSIWLVPVLAAITHFPANLEIATDVRVYVFLTTVSALAGIGAGLMPARHAVRHSLLSPLKGGMGASDGRARPGMRSVLIGAQAAASIVLLILAALSTRGMVRATAIDVGFDASRLLVMSPTFPRGAYRCRRREGLLGSGDGQGRRASGRGIRSRSRPIRRSETATESRHHAAKASGTRSITTKHAGRTILRRSACESFADARTPTKRRPGNANVAVISEALARDYFSGEDPIGQPLDRIVPGSKHVIIGVAANAITARLRDRSDAAIYQPMSVPLAARLVILDRRRSGRARAFRYAPRWRPRIRGCGSISVPVADGLERQLTEPRIVASLAGVLAALALALAVVGIYGVTAFVVGQRTQEISVRMALGASARDVCACCSCDSLRPVILGLAAASCSRFSRARLFASRAFAGILYGVSSLDPLAFGAAAAVLLAAALAAVIVPARRAAALEPASVLRQW